MVELPTKATEAVRLNPKRIILFSQPKTGKSEALSRLEDNLILDLEDGSGFIGGLKVNVLDLASKEKVSPLRALKMVIDSIRESNTKKGSYTYKYISIDTVSALEDTYGLELALKLYKDTPMGRNFQGTDVRTLPNGAGYGPLRAAVQIILNEVEQLCDTLIISGHTKEKVIESEGKEMTARGLDLAGKLASIVCAQSDAIAYLYRKDNKTIANFKPSESLTVGARPLHLKNKEIVLLESDENGNLTSHWDKIFV
jgi:hypothetical protein